AREVPRKRRVGLEGELWGVPVPRGAAGLEVGEWLRREGVHATGTVGSVGGSEELTSRLSWLWWQNVMHDLIERSVDDDVRPLFKAILLGEKSELDRDVRTAFSRAGLSHLMAVSGMHVGFVLMPIWIIIPWFWTSEFGRSAGLIIIALILFFYAGITGFTASVSRASITACLLAIGKLFQRNRDSLNTTGIAAIILLIWDPSSLFDVGFQMSFVAVTMILVLGPVLRDWTPQSIRFSWKGHILQFLGISVVVQAGLFPILADTFGEFSLAGPVANTAGVPITQLLFLWSMVALPLISLIDSLTDYGMIPAEYLAMMLLWIVNFVGSQDLSWINIYQTPTTLPLLWVAGTGILATSQISPVRFKWLIFLLILLSLTRIGQIIDRFEPDVLKITVYDVGQGDAILIQTPSGKNLMYDTGILSPFQNSGRTVILPDLQSRGINRLDAIILSHPHADHIGGTLSLIENLEIGAIYQPPFSYRSAVFSGYMAAASRYEIPIIEVTVGDVIDIDKSMRLLVLHPSDDPLGQDPNAHSVSIKMVYGETSFLLTGDAEQIAERVMVNRFAEFLKSDWYKAGHHGSKTSSTHEFMRYVDPEYAAVSLGYSNRYRHPHQEATSHIHEFSTEVGFTSLHRSLVYESDGQRIRRVVWY
ncbi:MAG: DNA internalization-related competence protein ComEC/Rec2, partial [Balneolales bacterium]|nr:DNA internalization-related competence protein ComEC/Rec2 [Balneolales bacterium]